MLDNDASARSANFPSHEKSSVHTPEKESSAILYKILK